MGFVMFLLLRQIEDVTFGVNYRIYGMESWENREVFLNLIFDIF